MDFVAQCHMRSQVVGSDLLLTTAELLICPRQDITIEFMVYISEYCILFGNPPNQKREWMSVKINTKHMYLL
uniref:Uncharacterized protein n=1 Tax=Rhizophora mucronata TaxID=61149 RepID=A0A2P2KQ03_RHIMU